MKKINLYDLYVIKVEKNGLTHRFICKKALFDESYVEVLTGEHITPNDSSEIVSLSKYYSPIATRDYTTGKPLMLDRSAILRKYIDINSETIIEREECVADDNKLLNVNDILDKAVSDLFPKTGQWGSDCFDRPDTVGIPYIPCHSRDDAWMAKLIRQNKEIYFLSLNRIIDYVKNSDFYKAKRHEYELEVVRWQIHWMVTGGDNWLVSDEYGGDFINFDASCDLGFRDSVIRTLTRIGMDPEVIEEGIEKNASMWRDSWMASAYRNRFDPILGFVQYPLLSGENHIPEEQLEHSSEEFKQKWLKLRKYEYYRDHKDSVDKYGEADSDMLMSDEYAEELRKEVRALTIERQKVISDFKKRREDERQKQFFKAKK